MHLFYDKSGGFSPTLPPDFTPSTVWFNKDKIHVVHFHLMNNRQTASCGLSCISTAFSSCLGLVCVLHPHTLPIFALLCYNCIRKKRNNNNVKNCVKRCQDQDQSRGMWLAVDTSCVPVTGTDLFLKKKSDKLMVISHVYF